MKKFIMGFAWLVAVTFAVEVGCKKNDGAPPVTPSQVEAGVAIANGVCSLIEGIDDSGVVRNVCATVDEVSQIVQFILTLRQQVDGGVTTAKGEPCVVLPNSTLCATSSERAKGVLYLSQVRARRFSRGDAGDRP